MRHARRKLIALRASIAGPICFRKISPLAIYSKRAARLDVRSLKR